MIGGSWHLGLLAGLIAVQLLVTYRAYRLRTKTLPGAVDAMDESLVDPEAGVVECPDCGTENEQGYRYCRSCVARLPAAAEFDRPLDDPLGRLTR